MVDTNGVDAGLLQSKYRLTKQRAAVLRALEDGTHLTAETILERVRRHLPSVSLGTVYRTLDILRDIGLVQAFAHAGGAARYEAALDKHHHLLCVHCQSITNIPANVEPVAKAIADEHNYANVDYALTITGTCPDCTRS